MCVLLTSFPFPIPALSYPDQIFNWKCIPNSFEENLVLVHVEDFWASHRLFRGPVQHATLSKKFRCNEKFTQTPKMFV